MAYIPVPGVGQPDLSLPGKNWANWLDNALLPGYLWEGTWDPEGILSTLPAIVTGIIGMLTGMIIIGRQDIHQKLVTLFFTGFMLFLGGLVMDWFFPINKNIWSSSYVIYTGGLAILSLAACILVVDVWGKMKWTFLGRVYGANAIVSYVLAGMLTVVFYRMKISGEPLNNHFMNGLASIGMAAELVSFLYAIIYMLIIFLPAYLLYRKRIFIKI
jgi:predicted acyltransferase